MNQSKSDFFRYVAQTSPESFAVPVTKAKGIYLYDEFGNATIDFISGICVSNLGHGDPDIIDAIKGQAENYLHPMVYGEVVMNPQIAYAKALIESLGAGFDKIYFGNSGADAIEGALKIAKKYTGRQKIVAFENSYHGSTHGALSVTGNEEMKQGYGPLLPHVHFAKFNQTESLATIDEETACVIIEPIQGAAGVLLPEPAFLSALEKRCKAVGALLILDEVQTGFGRTGTLFAFQKFNLIPDIVVLAKALGGGMPIGAIASRDEVISVIQKNPILGLISTFGGHPVCCAAGLASLTKINSQAIRSNVQNSEQVLLSTLKHPYIVELRGIGLLYALILPDFEFAETVRARSLKKGLLTIGFLNIKNGLRISPPLNITEQEMITSCHILLEAIEFASTFKRP